MATAAVLLGPAGLANARDAVDVTEEQAETAAVIAQLNAEAITAEAGDADNESCTFGAWSAVNQEAVHEPGTVFVYGRDVAASDATCVNVDPFSTAGSYDAVLVTTFEYLTPGTDPRDEDNWNKYAFGVCRQPSAFGHAVIENCLVEHQFTELDDEIQTYTRRTHFELFVERDGVRTLKSERYFGPIADDKLYLNIKDLLSSGCGGCS